MADPESGSPPALGDDADRLISRALASVLNAIPELPGGEIVAPDASPKSQPWAETAAPPGGNKRALEAVVEEYRVIVAAHPDARAGQPSEPHPATTYMDRFSPTAGDGSKRPGRRRWHGGRRRRGGGRRGRGGGGQR